MEKTFANDATDKGLISKFRNSSYNSISKRQTCFPGPVVMTLCFHCRVHGFNPWLGKFLMPPGAAKKKPKPKPKQPNQKISRKKKIGRRPI